MSSKKQVNLNPESSRRFLTMAQFMAEAQIGRATAYRLAASGEIPSVRFGPKSIRIPASALDALAGGGKPMA